MQKLTKTLLSRPEISALVMLLVVAAGFALYAPQFASSANARVILFAVPELGIVALGVGILMIAGEFDLSVGSVFALVPMVIVIVMGAWGIDPALAITLGLASALVVGYVNGWITLTFGIPSFVTTLGMLFIVRSIATVLSGGFPPPFPAGHADLAVRFGSGPVPQFDAMVRGLDSDSGAHAAWHQPRQLDLRHRRPAAGGG